MDLQMVATRVPIEGAYVGGLGPSDVPREGWVKALAKELFHPDARFRSDIARYAADFEPRRTLFPPLVEIRLALQSRPWSEDEAAAVLELVTKTAPSRQSGSAIKKDVFLPSQLVDDQGELLLAFSSRESAGAFGSFEDRILGLLVQLTTERAETAVAVLRRLREGQPRIFALAIETLSESLEFLRFTMAAAPDIAVQLTVKNPHLLVNLTANSALALDLERLLDQTFPVWGFDEVAATPIARHLVEEGRFAFASRFARGSDSCMPQALLSAIQSTYASAESRSLVEEIFNWSPAIVIDWVARRPDLALPFVSGFIGRIAPRQIASSPDFDVQRWSDSSQIVGPHSRLIALACSFVRCPNGQEGFFAAHIESVYRELLHSRYDWPQWKQLEETLPKLRSVEIDFWDRAKAIRCALLTMPRTCGLSAESVLGLLPSWLASDVAETFYELRKRKQIATELDAFWVPVFGKKRKKSGLFR